MPLQLRRWSSFQSFQILKCSKCLLAQGIKDQVKKFDKIVAIVAGTHFNHLRRFWNTPTLPENKSTVEGLFREVWRQWCKSPTGEDKQNGTKGANFGWSYCSLDSWRDLPCLKRNWSPQCTGWWRENGWAICPGLFTLLVLDGFFKDMAFCIREILLA